MTIWTAVALLLVGSADAGDVVGTLMGGYYVEQGSDDTGSPSLELELGYRATSSFAVFTGFGSFEVSTVPFPGSVRYAQRNVFVPVFARAYLGPQNEKVYFAADLGSTVNFLHRDIRFGLLGGLGVILPLGPIDLIARTRYSWVPKWGQLDFSTWQIMAGVHTRIRMGR